MRLFSILIHKTDKETREKKDGTFFLLSLVLLFFCPKNIYHLYSAHDLMVKSSGVIVQNALMNALARRHSLSKEY